MDTSNVGTSQLDPPASAPNIPWSAKGGWSLYEFIIPTCFLNSIAATFEAMAAPARGSVLDIGCGSGLALKVKQSWLQSGGTMTCADPDRVGLALAAQRAQQLGVVSSVRFAELSAQNVDQLGHGSFDGAFAHFSLYTITELEQRQLAVQKAFRVLKPGARFAYAVPSEGYERRALAKHARAVELQRKDAGAWTRWRRAAINISVLQQTNRKLDEMLDQGLFHRYQRDELVAHLTAAGFQDIDVRHVDGFNAYLGVGRRPPA